ncbi:MAG: hypothetical protein LBD69_03175 [Puniceicoccales bacterium]|nr:hypothetical protein [Puniceicoccales bacterium]
MDKLKFESVGYNVWVEVNESEYGICQLEYHVIDGGKIPTRGLESRRLFACPKNSAKAVKKYARHCRGEDGL